MVGEKATRRECRDCIWWNGRSCSAGEVRREARDHSLCERFIRAGLHFAFFMKM